MSKRANPTVIGAFVVSRLPGNSIGWLFCVAGIPFGVSGVAYGWGTLQFQLYPEAYHTHLLFNQVMHMRQGKIVCSKYIFGLQFLNSAVAYAPHIFNL